MSRIAAVFTALSLLSLAPLTLVAQPQVRDMADPTEEIELQVGETRLLMVSEEIHRISVADPEVADVQAVTQEQVLVTAEEVGSTDLILWGQGEQPFVASVEVVRNLDQLRAQLDELFPDEDIRVGSAGELVVLSGEVSDLRLPARAAELAGLYSDQLANLIEVRGDQQVQLEVRFAEVSRTALKQLGMNFLFQGGDLGSHVGGQIPPGAQTGSYFDVPGAAAEGAPRVGAPDFQGAFNLFFSTGLSNFPFSAILSVLSSEGFANTLAEPTLVALSGQEADFHAGGEIPILIARDLGQTSVEYREFGIQLEFVPTVLGGGEINLDLHVEVSEPDPATSVTLGGFEIPGLRTRQSGTNVRLRDGQSFAIAGLLSDDVRTTVDKVPFLGDIPILGQLFRSQAFEREETELLVVVEANMVRPVDAEHAPPLPGRDELLEPTDFELFILGRTRPRTRDEGGDGGDRGTRDAGDESPAVGEVGPAGPVGFMRDP